jgi:hypothetical protein
MESIVLQAARESINLDSKAIDRQTKRTTQYGYQFSTIQF